MALPTITKTWQYSVNILVGGRSGIGYDSNFADAILKLKNALKAFGSSPWTVWGSTDGISLVDNGGSTDYWATYNNIRFTGGGTAHSWIVLQQPGLGASASICIDLDYAGQGDTSYFTVVAFPTGVGTPGTITNRPSAADEITMGRANLNYLGYMPLGFGVIHVMQSTDGECTRIIQCQNNFNASFWLFDKPRNPLVAWINPIVVYAYGSSTTPAASYSFLNDSLYAQTRISTDMQISLAFMSEGLTTQTIGEHTAWPDDDMDAWPMTPIYLASATVPHRGAPLGNLFDLWWGSSSQPTGTCYPDSTSKQFIQFGHLICPWNGTVPQIA